MTTAVSAAGLLLAGVVAGVIGTAGGISSLVSYPALLVAGLPPLQANVVNLVASGVCWPGSALSSRRELVGAGPWLMKGLPVAAAGAAAGAALLLLTPAGAFTAFVPFLVALGSLALLASPALVRWRGRGHPAGAPPGASRMALPWVGLLAVYGGYFGAGSGVMLLTAVLVLLDVTLPEANALKNMLLGAASVASAGVLVLAGPVVWSAVAPLAVGLFVGSTIGPVLTRCLPTRLVRWCVGGLGLAVAARLWLAQG